jgi:hypothetical protein
MSDRYTYTESVFPTSSMFTFMAYNVVDKNLFVKFSGNGVMYGYRNVPKHVWESLVQADSVGSYFNGNVKYTYDSIPGIINVEYINPKTPAENHTWTLIGESPVEYNFEGATLEDAKADFARLFPNGVLKEVKVTLE